VALTSIVCGPSERAAGLKGELQAANAPSSMRHSNVAPGSLEVNVKEGALVRVGPEGPSAMLVSGGVVSGGDAVVLAVQVTVPHGAKLGRKVKLPEAAWVAGNDPLSVNPPLNVDENEWSTIGMPGGAIIRLTVQADPGGWVTVNPETLPPSAETRNSTVPPPEWVPV
jgi:hypothetical protein